MGLQTSGGGGDCEKAGPKLIAARRALRRLLRCLVACLGKSLDCVDVCVKWLGPAFVLLALGLFAFEAYVFFRYILPRIREAGASLAWTVFLGSTGVFVLFNMLYNYGMAICVSPGRPPLYAESDLSLSADAELGAEGAPKKCQTCLRQKNSRTHHCSVCGQCVLKMDHHCPWINNCVGFRNYRYFCLFLWYLAGCCAFVSVVFWEAFFVSIWSPRRSRLPRFARQSISLCWMIAFCILLAAFVLGGFHLYLVLSNQTTIEYHINRSNQDKARRKGELYRNPYDLGRRRNFQQVFGPHAICGGPWMLPYLARGPSGDGTHFPSMTELRA